MKKKVRPGQSARSFRLCRGLFEIVRRAHETACFPHLEPGRPATLKVGFDAINGRGESSRVKFEDFSPTEGKSAASAKAKANGR